MKWLRQHRPVVHYYFWITMMILDLFMALLCTWASLITETIAFVLLALFSFGCIKIWQYWIENPEDYEKLYKERLRRFGGRDGRTRRDGKNKKKENSDK